MTTMDVSQPSSAKRKQQDAKHPSSKRHAATKKKSDKVIGVSAVSLASEPPSKILVIDQGGDSLKFGWSTDNSPRQLSNVTARLQQQWTTLAGDQLGQIQNPNQLIGVTRSTERGIIVHLGNQIQVWKRLIDILDISVSLHTETAQALGWKNTQRPQLKDQSASSARKTAAANSKIPASACAVLLALPPFCPRSVLDQILFVWMEDFGFSHVGFCVSSECAAVPHPLYETCCVVDIGWSSTHIVPTHREKVIQASAIRRVPIAGRHLINMLKYHASYRQYNLMDQEWILRDVLHQTGYVSMHFRHEMALARRLGGGKRPYDREYVLPDYQDTFVGRVQLPLALQQQENTVDQGEEVDEEDDSDHIDENQGDDEEVDDEDDNSGDRGTSKDESEDSEDDDPAQRRMQLLKKRETEAQLRREMESEQQVLQISVERFAIPETLFRPSDAGLPTEWAGLPTAIVQSIEACPKSFQPALYQSVRLVGGLSQLPNLKERLEQELRALAPCHLSVLVEATENPVEQAWLGACRRARETPHHKWSVNSEEWHKSSKRGVWSKLQESNVGCGWII